MARGNPCILFMCEDRPTDGLQVLAAGAVLRVVEKLGLLTSQLLIPGRVMVKFVNLETAIKNYR